MLNKPPGKILIADNDEDVLIAIEHALETSGYTTVTAFCHDEASKLFRDETFDLCVLDDYLSDRDSTDFLAELQTPGRGPLIVLTYHRFPSPQQEERFRCLGVSAFVNKRAHSQLVDIVSHLLRPMNRRPSGALYNMT